MVEKTEFQDEEHVLALGVLWGTLLKSGIECIPVGNDSGGYKPYLQIVIPNPLDLEPIRVTIQVIPGAPRGEQDE